MTLRRFLVPHPTPFRSSKPYPNLCISNLISLSVCCSMTMNSASRSKPSSSSATTWRIPQFSMDQIGAVAEEAFHRYTTSENIKRNGVGVAIVWFRNDLRVLDNEALFEAWKSSESVLPVYCVDPRSFGTTHYFKFPKTGALRAQFLIEGLAELKKNLLRWGLNLLVHHGKPEDFLPLVAKVFGAHTVMGS